MRITRTTQQALKTERFKKVNIKISGLLNISVKFEHQSSEALGITFRKSIFSVLIVEMLGHFKHANNFKNELQPWVSKTARRKWAGYITK